MTFGLSQFTAWLQDIRDGFAQMRPGRFPYARFALAVALGLCGGLLFQRLGLPLPWMMGPMVFCTLAALLKAPVAAPPVIRPPMTMVIGVMLGSAFSPDLMARLVNWWPATLGLVGFIILCGGSVVWYFRSVGGYDRTTAYFAGMPGGLVEMITIGEERGGDGRIIALVHSVRILLIVMTVPFAIQWLEGVSLNRLAGAVSMFAAPLTAEAWLLGCGLAGAFLGHLLRLPAQNLLGPMLVSAAVHLIGWSDFKPPFEIVNAAQLTLGIVIGCRFAGTAASLVLRIIMLSLGSTVILLFWTAASAMLVSWATGMSAVTLVLAYSPGGLAEMSLIALALHAEVAFVAAHHIVRIFVVMVAAAPVYAVLDRLGPRAPAAVPVDEARTPAE
jgi:membrane AbrB-like protein